MKFTTRQEAVAYFYKTQVRPYLPGLDEGLNWVDIPGVEKHQIELKYLRQTSKCQQVPKIPCDCLTNCGDSETHFERLERIRNTETVY